MLTGLRNVGTGGGHGPGAESGCHMFHTLTHSCRLDTDSYRKATSVDAAVGAAGHPIRRMSKAALQIPALNEPALPPRGARILPGMSHPKFTEPPRLRPGPPAD